MSRVARAGRSLTDMTYCDRWMSSAAEADDLAVVAFTRAATHPGILLIYEDNKPSDMGAVEIVQARFNLIEMV